MDSKLYTRENHICVIIPTYNNAKTLPKVISEVAQFTENIIVVNDGSTDETSKILTDECFSNIQKIEYQQNKGKGHALKRGFEKSLSLGYEYAITIDSDGQHFASDIPEFLEKHATNLNSLIVGVRSFGDENMPNKNRFANNFSNFWFRFQTRNSLSDTQCGFRLYPLKRIGKHWPITSRYESELEYLVFSAWRGIPIIPLKINVYYPPSEERVSHFRPFHDFVRITILNSILSILSLLLLPIRIVRKLAK